MVRPLLRALAVVASVAALVGCGVSASEAPVRGAYGPSAASANPAVPGADAGPDAATPSPVPFTPAEGARPSAAATDGDGRFAVHRHPDGSVVRWDPCTPISWKLNPSAAPPGAAAELDVAFAALGRATGMTFRYAGTTTTTPTSEWLQGADESDTIVVAWVPKGASDLWQDAGDGRGGWYSRGVTNDGTTWTWRIVKGFVLVDPDSAAGYASGFGSGVTTGALLLHELAHVVGLDHVSDVDQLMHPTLSDRTAARYSAGDLDGLLAVGRAAGCITGT